VDPARSAAFYRELLGVEFVLHQHGHGPKHWTAEISGCVFELYPMSAHGAQTNWVRIGFSVPSLESVLARLTPAEIRSPAADSEWGRRAVVVDPDHHAVELLEQVVRP